MTETGFHLHDALLIDDNACCRLHSIDGRTARLHPWLNRTLWVCSADVLRRFPPGRIRRVFILRTTLGGPPDAVRLGVTLPGPHIHLRKLPAEPMGTATVTSVLCPQHSNTEPFRFTIRAGEVIAIETRTDVTRSAETVFGFPLHHAG